MKDIIHELLTGLARWPLLMGAAICFGFALYEEMAADNTEILLGVGGLVVGCILLGGWLVSYIVAGERRHYAERAPIWKESGPPERSDSEGPSDPREGEGPLLTGETPEQGQP